MAHARKPSRRAATGPPVAEPASPVGGDRRSPVVVGRGHQRRLDLTLVRGSIADVSTRALVLSLFANVDPTGAARAVDERLGGAISDVVRSRMFSPDAGSLFVLPTPRSPLRTEFVVLAGLGAFDRFGPPVIEMVSSNVTRTLIRANVEEFATILLGGNSGQDVADCTAHLLRGVLAGVRDVDDRHRFRGLELVEIDRSRFQQIRDEVYDACRTDVCDDFEIAIRTVETEERVDQRTGSVAAEGSGTPRRSSIYLLVRTEQVTKDRLRLRVAALTTGAKAALLDDPIDVDLAKLRDGVDEIGQTGFDQSRLEKFGKAIGESALPSRVRDELEKFAGHHLTMVHDREASLIPWETMRLAAWVPALDAGLSRRYLANDVAVARWSEQRQSAPELRVLVVANPTGDLPGAEKEGRRVAQIASSNSWITVESLEGKKATAQAVLAALSSERYDVIHYAGHAFFARDSPGQSGVVCSDRTLAATELLNLRKLPALMFFNACESARTRRQDTPRAGAGKRLADSVGFAESLMRAGVANYVGTYWPVGDEAADEFSRTFYESLLAGESLGGSLLQSRRRVLGLKSIDWADYVHYGDPDFRLKLAGKSPR